ncbi:hypothetical protein M408DRAFT_326939 [Serendipita vermifera MAFF 305830]|uniref:Transmembrane protein n=1 Tax=Serendipita vermifera MAFF 305830 TaxID=933852 RepID=A0A0C3B680_SERVB|nr:hypothetical protein M408DRAFT_326939 [Serendipita vermifera MAFF 305830]
MKYNVTIDDVSPLVNYSPGWIDSLPSGEATPSYQGDSYHSTQIKGSSASFTFIGTSVFVFGSKGSDHGKLAVTLDGSEHILDGFSATNIFQTALFSQVGLPFARHTLKVSNLIEDPARPRLYIDYFQFETGQDDDVANASFNIDDNNSTLSYSPADAWETTVLNLDKYYGGTVHTSKTPGATLSTRFEGNAIYIYGAVSPGYGTLDIMIDGGATTRVNCSSSAFRPQTLLFYSNDFASGGHSLSLQIPSNASAVPIDVDFITITRWSDNNGLGSGKALTPIIAGSICGALVLLAWLTYLSHWYYLRRQKRKHMNEEMLKASDMLALRAQQKKASTGSSTSPPPKSREAST